CLLSPILFCPLTPQPRHTSLFPYTTLFRSGSSCRLRFDEHAALHLHLHGVAEPGAIVPPDTGFCCLEGHGCRRLGTALHVDAVGSEEHTSELQSRENLVCRLLLDKNNQIRV